MMLRNFRSAKDLGYYAGIGLSSILRVEHERRAYAESRKYCVGRCGLSGEAGRFELRAVLTLVRDVSNAFRKANIHAVSATLFYSALKG